MADCNIRNIEEGLMAQMKKAAVDADETLREWCIGAFEGRLRERTFGLDGEKAGLAQTAEQPPRKRTVAGSTSVSGSKNIAEAVNDRPRPTHAEGCPCARCKPPKEGK